MSRVRILIGVDEVGRGPLAGPVAVGAFRATPTFIKKFHMIKESKQLSPRARDEWYKKLSDARGRDCDFAVSYVSARTIDRIGIASAIRRAVNNSLAKLAVSPRDAVVLLDGGLRAPIEYTKQKTIIHGDANETIIAMASVVAKVLRDRRMVNLGKKYPHHGFEVHKGYGTKSHISAIKKHGLTPEHRRSFCGGLSIHN